LEERVQSVPIRLRSRRAWTFLAQSFLVIVFCTVALPSLAQSQLQDQIDFNTARSDAVLGTSPAPSSSLPTIGSLVSYSLYPNGNSSVTELQGPQAPAPPIFNSNFLSPLSYARSQANGKSGISSANAVPEIKTGFLVHPSETLFQFSGFLDLSSSRYTGSTANSDRLDGLVRVDFVGSDPFPDRASIIPYVSYAPQQTYAPLFSKGELVTQDLMLGVNKLWDFAPNWTKYNTVASDDPAWEIGLQLSGQHRIVNSGADSNAIIFGPSIKWAATNAVEFPHKTPEDLGKLAASIGLNITRRWYESYQDYSERVWSVAPILTVSWVLPGKWFGKSGSYLGSPELDFQIAYSDLNSTVGAKSSRQLGVGPTLKANWNF
jgi:hypothetical protein